MNRRELNTVHELEKKAKGAHSVDIKVRADGQDFWFEGDWLLELLEAYVAKQGEAEPVRAQTAPKGELASEEWNKQLAEILIDFRINHMKGFFGDGKPADAERILKSAIAKITALKDAEVERVIGEDEEWAEYDHSVPANHQQEFDQPETNHRNQLRAEQRLRAKGRL